MPASCQFKFTRMTPIYYGGEQLNGSIYLSTTKPLLLEAIELTLTGHERVQWCEWSKYPVLEHNDSSTMRHRIPFQGKQVLVNDRRSLAGSVQLEPRKLRIDKFCFLLPKALPATFSHQFGEVSYSLNVILHRLSAPNKVFKQRIVLRKRLNLSERPKCNVPRSVSSDDSEQPVKLSVLCTGFLPSQGIAYHVENLDTAPECTKVQLNLCRYYSFRSLKPHPKTKTIESLVATNTEKVICSTVTGVLHIPLATPISSTEELTLIEISYYLEAVLYTKRRILQKLVIPIVIGTVRPTRVGDGRNSISTSGGPYCYDNFASTVASCASINGDAATFKLACSRDQQQQQQQVQQQQQYIAHMPRPYANVCHEDIELSLFKRMGDCDRRHLMAMAKVGVLTNNNNNNNNKYTTIT